MANAYTVKVNINKPIGEALQRAVPSQLGEVHLSFHENMTETTIPKNMYANLSNVTHVTIPASVASIESHAFANCKNLAHVHFAGKNLPEIHPLAFVNCSLKRKNGKR